MSVYASLPPWVVYTSLYTLLVHLPGYTLYIHHPVYTLGIHHSCTPVGMRGGPGLKEGRSPWVRRHFLIKSVKSVKSVKPLRAGSSALPGEKRVKDWIAHG